MEPVLIGIVIAIIVIVLVVLVSAISLSPSPPAPTTSPMPASAMTQAQVSAPVQAPVLLATMQAPVLLAVPAKPTPQTVFNGNNGTVSGARYCSGNWESTSGEKNMTCVNGKNNANGATLDCSSVYGLGGPYTYTCSTTPVVYKTYNDNNGTVSGDTYCRGGWESTTGNKNMPCLYGKNNTSGAALNCNDVYGLGPSYTYTCAA